MPRPGSSPSRVSPVGPLVAPVLPGQPAAAERAPRQQPQPGVQRGRHDLPLDLADDQAVLRLQRHRRGQAERAGQVHRLGELPAGEVRQPVVADLAGPDEAVERPQRLLQRRHAGRTRAPGRGRRGRRRAGRATRRARGSGAGADSPTPFGSSPIGNRPLVASTTRSVTSAGPVGEPAADDLLRHAGGVHVGGVDQRAAGLDEPVELLVRAGLVGLGAEGHRAEASSDTAQPLRPEGSVVHAHVSTAPPRAAAGFPAEPTSMPRVRSRPGPRASRRVSRRRGRTGARPGRRTPGAAPPGRPPRVVQQRPTEAERPLVHGVQGRLIRHDQVQVKLLRNARPRPGRPGQLVDPLERQPDPPSGFAAPASPRRAGRAGRPAEARRPAGTPTRAARARTPAAPRVEACPAPSAAGRRSTRRLLVGGGPAAGASGRRGGAGRPTGYRVAGRRRAVPARCRRGAGSAYPPGHRRAGDHPPWLTPAARQWLPMPSVERTACSCPASRTDSGHLGPDALVVRWP